MSYPDAILRTYVREAHQMSELRSAVEMLRSEALPDLPDARIEEDFAELQRVVEMLEVERLRRLAEIDRRRLFERDGHLSAASWLAATHKVAWGAARENVRVARALDEMPVTRQALDAGELSMSAARVLIAARDADPSAFARSEAQLVEAARIHTMQDLRRVAAFWREAADRQRSLEGADKLRQRRRLHASVSFLGMVRVDGDLDAETGETLLTALSAVLDAESRSRGQDDDRTPAQRRADALGEICRQWLDLAEKAERGRRATARHGDRWRGGTSERFGGDQRDGPRGPGRSGRDATARVRRIGDARGDGRSVAAS